MNEKELPKFLFLWPRKVFLFLFLTILIRIRATTLIEYFDVGSNLNVDLNDKLCPFLRPEPEAVG